MRELSENTLNQKADVSEIFANNCRGAESIRNFSVKDLATKSFSKACMKLVRSNLTLTIFASKLSILGSVARWVGFTGTLIFGLFLTNWFTISLPDLMLASNIACLVKMMLSGLGDNWTGIQSTMVETDRILTILNTKDTSALLPNLPVDLPETSASDYLQVCNLTFKYSQEQTVLENFKLSVKKGEIAIVLGESGSGKSTLLAIIMGLIDPQEGKILLEGLDCSQYNRLSRTNHVHYILQETELFDTSIEENILLGFGDPTKGKLEDAVKAAKLAEIHDFILTLPNGYETEVGEAGKNLSGGQRQRILIA